MAGGILVCVVEEGGAVIHERVLSRPETVRQAATLTTPNGPWVVLALRDESDPSAPARVIALDPYGSALTPDAVLGGTMNPDHRVDRRMIAEGDRLVVATSAGLEALVLGLDPPGFSVDPGFSGTLLRGPIER